MISHEEDPSTLKPVFKFTVLFTHGSTIKSQHILVSLKGLSPNSHRVKSRDKAEPSTCLTKSSLIYFCKLNVFHTYISA